MNVYVKSNVYVIDNFQGGLFRLTGKALTPDELPIDFCKNKIIKRYTLIRFYLSKPCKIILEKQILNLITFITRNHKETDKQQQRNKLPR